MNIIDATKSFYSNYANFGGSATRSEFWWAALGVSILGIAIQIINAYLFEITYETMDAILFIVSLIPALAIGWRRNHDVGVSGWWSLLPFVNLYFFVQPSKCNCGK